MKNKILIILILFMQIYANENKPTVIEIINDESIFIYNKNKFKIVIDGELRYKKDYIDNELIFEFRVYKNGKEIYSNDEHNFIYANCDYANGGPFENHYEIDYIQKENNKIGWIIYTGGICGNTFSYQADVIIPPIENGTRFVKSNQLFSTKPNITIENNKINIYYSFLEWNLAGTAWSEFIPQKLTYDISNNNLFNSNIKTDDFKNLRFDFNIDYEIDLSKNFTSLFMSGFHDMNLNLMQYAIDNLYNSDHREDWYDYFYGANFEYHRSMMEFKDDYSKNLFIWGLAQHYGHKNIKWMFEFYTKDGFKFHENDVINTKHKYIRLTDCSKDSFQKVVDQLR